MDIYESYKEVTRLLGDLDFMGIEHRFFKHLMKEYLNGTGLVNETVIEALNDRLLQLGADIHLLRRDTVTCQSQIGLVIENAISIKRIQIAQDLKSCINRLNILFTDFRTFKTELYTFVSQIFKIESDE